jgi:hypothetical protein
MQNVLSYDTDYEGEK